MIWDRPLEDLAGVGPRRAAALERRGLRTLLDLLNLQPVRYSLPAPLQEHPPLPEDSEFSLLGEVLGKRRGRLRRGGGFLDLRVHGAGGEVTARFYNQAWLMDRFSRGDRVLISGRLASASRPLMVVSRHQRIESDGDLEHIMHVPLAIPPRVDGVPGGILRKLVDQALQLAQGADDPLPEEIRKALDLPHLARAFRFVHRPDGMDDPPRGARRLLFDRFLALFLPVVRQRPRREGAPSISVSEALLERIRSRFPYEFTPGQDRALRDILDDLRGPAPMRRLLQGDVGCGKTAVALAAALTVVAARRQVLFLAPTEPLMEQHHATISNVLRGSRVRVGRLKGGLGRAERRALLHSLEEGEVDILVATQACLSADVRFNDLALAIIDEQHRFGVRQRLAASAKGRLPHLLVMSATPIPRSLRLALLGDLDHSAIQDRPGGRGRVSTAVVSEEEARRRLRRAAERGGRAFVVFPSIDAEGMPALLPEVRRLARGKSALNGIATVFVHGRMPREEAATALDAFRRGKARVLLATSVVEVGLDVPEATLMVVFGAERFGLSTLHQLRGRVGRGGLPGVCLLVPAADAAEEAVERLQVMVREHDGFRIAEEDLRLRGPGDVLGFRQAGPESLMALGKEADEELFKAAFEAAERIVSGRETGPGDSTYLELLARSGSGFVTEPAGAG